MRRESSTVVSLAGEPSDRPGGAAEFGQQAAAALPAWQADRFELPGYYLLLTAATGQPGGAGPAAPQGAGDFCPGPLRAGRPRRVVAVMTADGPEAAARVRHELRSLRHGPWWPPLPGVLAAARRFFPGGLAERQDSPAGGRV